MLLKIWLANIVLAAAVLFVGMKTVEVWTEKRPFKISSAQHPLTWAEKSVAKGTMPPESDYQVVVSDNLFFVDRSEMLQKKAEQTPIDIPKVNAISPKMLERDFKLINLYGVIMVDDYKVALITEIPARGRQLARPGEKRIKRAKVGNTVGKFKVGDAVGSFKVKAINNKSVLLTAGGHEWQISLFDKDKPKKRARIKKETGPIVIVGGSKMKSVLTDAKAVGKRPTPKPAVSKKETLSKVQNKKRTIPVPTDRSKTKKR